MRTLRTRRRRLAAMVSTLGAAAALALPVLGLPAIAPPGALAPSALAATARTAPSPAGHAGHGVGDQPLQSLPNLPVNACNDSTLPRDYGTNFPVPNDPSGFGFANQSVIGWEGNIYAPIN